MVPFCKLQCQYFALYGIYRLCSRTVCVWSNWNIAYGANFRHCNKYISPSINKCTISQCFENVPYGEHRDLTSSIRKIEWLLVTSLKNKNQNLNQRQRTPQGNTVWQIFYHNAMHGSRCKWGHYVATYNYRGLHSLKTCKGKTIEDKQNMSDSANVKLLHNVYVQRSLNETKTVKILSNYILLYAKKLNGAMFFFFVFYYPYDFTFFTFTTSDEFDQHQS